MKQAPTRRAESESERRRWCESSVSGAGKCRTADAHPQICQPGDQRLHHAHRGRVSGTLGRARRVRSACRHLHPPRGKQGVFRVRSWLMTEGSACRICTQRESGRADIGGHSIRDSATRCPTQLPAPALLCNSSESSVGSPDALHFFDWASSLPSSTPVHATRACCSLGSANAPPAQRMSPSGPTRYV